MTFLRKESYSAMCRNFEMISRRTIPNINQLIPDIDHLIPDIDHSDN